MSELRRLWLAWGYSKDGFKQAWREDAPFRLEVLLSVMILPLGFYLGHTGVERALLLVSWLLVPLTELLNIGLETLTDYATKGERHALAKKTKDAGSAAVVIAVVIFLCAWVCVLMDHPDFYAYFMPA